MLTIVLGVAGGIVLGHYALRGLAWLTQPRLKMRKLLTLEERAHREQRRERRRKWGCFWRRYVATFCILLIVGWCGGSAAAGVKGFILMFPIALPPALLWFGLHLERMRRTVT